jgi:hypothetical protein
VALMNDDLSRVPFLIELARRSRAIIAQNIAASIVIAVLGLVLAATGMFRKTGEFALPLAACTTSWATSSSSPTRSASSALASGRIIGKSITSRMVRWFVRSITRRSTPRPMPPAGGMPTFRAFGEVLVEGAEGVFFVLVGVETPELLAELRLLDVGVVELGVVRGDLHAGDEEVGAVGERRVVAAWGG